MNSSGASHKHKEVNVVFFLVGGRGVHRNFQNPFVTPFLFRTRESQLLLPSPKYEAVTMVYYVIIIEILIVLLCSLNKLQISV